MKIKRRSGRPRGLRHVNFSPHVTYFKPRGIPLSQLEEISLTREELEALLLKNIENFDQIECAKKMHTSQSTFQRILSSAYKKISQALIKGQAIKIHKDKNV